MIAQYPDLEEIVSLQPALGRDGLPVLDITILRRQIDHALSSADIHDYYHAGREVAKKIDTIIGQGIQYMDQKQWKRAALVFITVAEEILDQYDAVETWRDVLASIRHHKPRLPALLDELKQAGVH